MGRGQCGDEGGKLQFSLTSCAHGWVLLLNVNLRVQWGGEL